MNIIKVTPLLKRRVKQMVKDLLSEYNYVHVTKHGLVILKTKWWSFKKTILNVTDLFIDVLPNRLAENCKHKGYGDTYARMFNNDLYVILQLKAYKKTVDIVDYIWNKYNVLYREVPTLFTNVESAILEDQTNRYLPVFSPISSYFIPGVVKLLRRSKRGSVDGLIEKISKIQLRRPKMLYEASRFIINIPGLQYA